MKSRLYILLGCMFALCSASCSKKYYPAMYEPAIGSTEYGQPRDKVVIMTEEYAKEELPTATAAASTVNEEPLLEDDTVRFETPVVAQASQAAASEEKIRTATESYSTIEGGSLQQSYHVVVGSFQSQVNAVNLCNQLKKDGADAQVVVADGTKYRVFYYSTDNEPDLRAHLAEARKLYPDAWMLYIAK